MKASWRRYADMAASRYTSFPSALHFDASVRGRDLAQKCRELDLYAPISLYVHLPFCRQLCWYCGCAMRVENHYSRALEYVEALIGEIALLARSLEGRGRTTCVHFGGGTPNYLEEGDIGRILSAIEAQLGLTDDARLAIELDPRLLARGDVERFVALGFGRISLGVQDFDPDVQAAINRRQSYELVEARVSDIRAAGIDDLSFDILYGLPRQTPTGFEETLEKVVALSPDRVCVFGDAPLPERFARRRMTAAADLPDGAARAECAEAADRRLVAAGYRRVGFDHYARPGTALARAAAAGRLRRDFQGFTEAGAAVVLGLGASAVSFIDGLYAQNEKDVGRYVARLKRGLSPVARGRRRTRRDEIVAAAIADLLCRMEADVGPVLNSAGPLEGLRISRALAELESDGVISWQGDRVRLAEGAHALARAVAAVLDPYAASAEQVATAI
jgi:oxygen-independent coproporphyrinogen-3 oxidase